MSTLRLLVLFALAAVAGVALAATGPRTALRNAVVEYTDAAGDPALFTLAACLRADIIDVPGSAHGLDEKSREVIRRWTDALLLPATPL